MSIKIYWKDVNHVICRTLLTQEQVERIHDAALEILEDVGLKVRYEPARDIFAKAWLLCGWRAG